MNTINKASPIWAWLWLGWALGGVGTALAIIVAQELSMTLPHNIWRWWAIPGVLGGGTLEIVALTSGRKGDTLSEHIWQLQRGFRSIIVVFCLWAAWFLATASAWPSGPIFFMCWCAYHFAFEAPE